MEKCGFYSQTFFLLNSVGNELSINNVVLEWEIPMELLQRLALCVMDD
jgi:hypothetical protein